MGRACRTSSSTKTASSWTARRRRSFTPTAALRSRACPRTRRSPGPSGSSRAASTCSPTSAAAASSARRGTGRRCEKTASAPTTTFSPSPRRSRHQVSRARRTSGIRGGSNGGLLMGVALTQRPELFNAVVVQVPLLDMLRYHKLLAGASWMAEYGDPDVPGGPGVHRALLALPERPRAHGLPDAAVYDDDPRRPRPPGPRAQDGGAHGADGDAGLLLREHRRAATAPASRPSRQARLWATVYTYFDERLR